MSDFDVALKGAECWLELADGGRVTLQAQRWRATEPSDEVLLAHCTGPTLDIGCGPGRLTSALTSRGVPVLGVDVSPVAVALTLARGAIAVRRNVFDPLPGEGRWQSVLLADGNIGIGGDPVALLRRIRRLISQSGRVLAELEPPGAGFRRQPVRVNGSGTWFPWAWVGADAVAPTARQAGFTARWIAEAGDRWFTELVPR
ncbi:class I SAM-dependent methyltransferase [Kibdelosporangium phytohabitans]|uniref:Methyltransferase type 12 n=1 Tax=Kibdelosporangium phytohabitans TaxID=860235 RepID=A0A0N9HWN8_9PSEU|nr:class I SAM-dependent methyltransferase [Kibdelosporangium phytohabitans]ALG06450.1 methyltransferase type 12 [Kibdelosporangium phytohabitans]MBE1467616.1 SAM-dependent methyltransferase [Kibdelosporangium phytohabitans]